jgi:hypothetical protein
LLVLALLSVAVSAQAKTPFHPPFPLGRVLRDGMVAVGKAVRFEKGVPTPEAYRLTLSVEHVIAGAVGKPKGPLVCTGDLRPLMRENEALYYIMPEAGKAYVFAALRQRDGVFIIPTNPVYVGDWVVNTMPLPEPRAPTIDAITFLIGLSRVTEPAERHRQLLRALSGTNAELQLYALQRLRHEALAKDEQERFYRAVREALLGDTATSPKVVVLADRIHAEHVPQYAESDERYERLLRLVRADEFDPTVSNQALAVLERMTGRRGALFTALMDGFERRPDGAVLNRLFRSLFTNEKGKLDRLSRQILALSLRCLSHKESWARLNAADFLALESTAKALGELGRDAKDVLVQLKRAHAAEQNPLTKDALTRAIARYEPQRPERN